MISSLITLLIIVLIAGIILSLVPMDPKMRQIAYVILALILVLWLLSFAGLLPRWERVGYILSLVHTAV